MNILVNRNDMVNLSGAIQTKLGGTPTEDPLTIKQMKTAIESISTDGKKTLQLTPSEPKTINFYDYNGQLLYAYTHEEAALLATLPEAPDHTDIGLTFQEWNETDLSFIHRVNTPTDIAAIYKPTDGKCHIGLTVVDTTIPDTSGSTYYFGTYCIGGTLHINWGDGSEDTVDCSHCLTRFRYGIGGSGSSPRYTWDNSYIDRIPAWHVYSNPGNYEITIWGENCSELILETCYLSYVSNNTFKRTITYIWYSEQVKGLGTGSTTDPQLQEGFDNVVIPNSVEALYGDSFSSYSGYNTKTVFIGVPKSLKQNSNYSFGNNGNDPYPWAKFSLPRTMGDQNQLNWGIFGSGACIRLPNANCNNLYFSGYSGYIRTQKVYLLFKQFTNSSSAYGFSDSTTNTAHNYYPDELYDSLKNHKQLSANPHRVSLDNGIEKDVKSEFKSFERTLAFTYEASGTNTLYIVPIVKNAGEIITEVS